jgi:F420H(2)-dependent quinone reductase
MNHVLNPVMKALLRSSIGGRRFGRRLALVTYQGRRTTAQHQLVAMYVRDGEVVWIVPGQPEKKLWWRNFRSPGNVELLLAGELVRGTAIAVEGIENPETVAVGLKVYLQKFPRARTTIEKGGSIQEAAHRSVIVRVQLVVD